MPSSRSPVGDWFERFPAAKDDEFLRKAGYEIFSRPRSGPTLWAKHSRKPVTQAAAMQEANHRSPPDA